MSIQNQFKLTYPLGSKDDNENQNFEWSLTSTMICKDEARALNPPWRGFTGEAKSRGLSAQFLSVSYSLRPHATPWTAAHQASLSITNSWSLLKLMSIKSVVRSNYLILCHPLLLPSIFPSIRIFSYESALLIRWPKYWGFSFSISSSSEYSGLISFRIDWLDLLAVQGTLKSLLQHHSSKASILWHSVFFIVQQRSI